MKPANSLPAMKKHILALLLCLAAPAIAADGDIIFSYKTSNGITNRVIAPGSSTDLLALNGSGVLAKLPRSAFLQPDGNGSALTNLNASALASGTVPTARLGSGTADSSSYLRGDGSWQALSGASLSTAQTWTAQQTFTPASTTGIAIVAKGLASQTADLMQWQNSAGTVVAAMAGGAQADNKIGVLTIYDRGIAKSSDGAILSVHADDASPYLAKFYNDTYSLTSPVLTYYGNSGGEVLFDGASTITIKGFTRTTQNSLTVGSASSIGPFGVVSSASRRAVIAHATSTAPGTTASSYYLTLGASEYAANSYRLIGLGYTGTHSPAFIGYQETSASGNTRGDVIMATRGATSDTEPTVRVRVKSSGVVNIADIPTSSAGLSTGDLWSDGGTLKIVP